MACSSSGAFASTNNPAEHDGRMVICRAAAFAEQSSTAAFDDGTQLHCRSGDLGDLITLLQPRQTQQIFDNGVQAIGMTANNFQEPLGFVAGRP